MTHSPEQIVAGSSWKLLSSLWGVWPRGAPSGTHLCLSACREEVSSSDSSTSSDSDVPPVQPESRAVSAEPAQPVHAAESAQSPTDQGAREVQLEPERGQSQVQRHLPLCTSLL